MVALAQLAGDRADYALRISSMDPKIPEGVFEAGALLKRRNFASKKSVKGLSSTPVKAIIISIRRSKKDLHSVFSKPAQVGQLPLYSLQEGLLQ